MVGYGKNGMFGRAVAGLLLISFLLSSCVTPNQVTLTSEVGEVQLVPLDPTGKPINPSMVFIEDIVPGSPAEEAGLHPHEQILEISGEIPLTTAHALSLLSDKEEISLKVLAADGIERIVPLVRRSIFGLYFKAENPGGNIVNAKGYSTDVLVTHRDYRPFKETLKPTETIPNNGFQELGVTLSFIGGTFFILGILIGLIEEPRDVYNYETGTWEEDPEYEEPGGIAIPLGLGMSAFGVLALAKGYSKTYPGTHKIPMQHFASNALYDDQGYNLTTGLDRYNITRDGRYYDGTRFEGKIVQGKREGYGVLISADGSKGLSGVFQNNLLNGIGKELILGDSDTRKLGYLGKFTDSQRDGAGIVFKSNGKPDLFVIYQKGIEKTSQSYPPKPITESELLFFLGEGFIGGLAEGKGLAMSLSGDRTREGLFRKGELVDGIKRDPDGTMAQGRFDGGFLIQGIKQNPDGSSGEGLWRNGRLQSPGKIVFADGNVYSGDFDAHGIPSGTGTMAYTNGDLYSGTLVQGIPEGRGTYRFKSGTTYTGELTKGMPQGKGKQVNSNGESFDGEFHAGLPHGMGIYKYGNLIERAEYYEGRRIDQAFIMREDQAKRAQLEAEARDRELAEQERILQEEYEAEESRLAAERAEIDRLERQQRAADFLEDLGEVTGKAYGMSDEESARIGQAAKRDFMSGNSNSVNKTLESISAERQLLREKMQQKPVPVTGNSWEKIPAPPRFQSLNLTATSIPSNNDNPVSAKNDSVAEYSDPESDLSFFVSFGPGTAYPDYDSAYQEAKRRCLASHNIPRMNASPVGSIPSSGKTPVGGNQ